MEETSRTAFVFKHQAFTAILAVTPSNTKNTKVMRISIGLLDRTLRKNQLLRETA